ADPDPQPRQRIGNEVVEIAADGAGGKKLGLNFEMLHLGTRMRQQAKLQFARQCQIVFQPLLLPRDVLVEARVFNGNRHLRRERGQGTLVILGEITAAGVLQIEDSDDLLLIDQRDRQLRARLRIHSDVALTLGHVRHQDPFLGLRRVSHHSPAKRDVVLQMQPFLEALREPVPQGFAVRIEQKNAEHLVVDQPLEQLCDALEQFVEIQNRSEFARNFIQQKQRAGLARDACVQASILYADCHARRDQRQQTLVLFGEVSLFAGLNVDHANHPVLDDQRDGEFRVHVGQGLNVEIFLRRIGDQYGLPSLGRASGYALAHFHAQAVGDLLRISHMEAYVQFLTVFVEQQDGENFVVNNLADQFRHAPQRGFQVERGVDYVGHFEQERVHLGKASSLRGGRFHRLHDSRPSQRLFHTFICNL